VAGTPAYFSPEQVTGEPVGPPTDVYALGLVLLECLTGRREYEGTPMEVAMARLSRPPAIPPSLPVPWRDVLGGMTARLPNGRLSASQAADRLRRMSGLATDSTVAMAIPPADPATVAMAMPTAVMPAVTSAGVEETVVRSPVARETRLWPWVLGLLALAAVVAAVVALLVHNNSSQGNGEVAGCQNLPTLNGRVGSDFTALSDLVCKGAISRPASRALAPYLGQLASAYKAKDISRLDAVDSNMSATITRQSDANHLTPQRAQNIADALTAFFNDATNRLNRPSPSPTPSSSPSETPSETPTVTPPASTPPPATPTQTPTSTQPTTTPTQTPTGGFTVF
jgi:serine/threonine protein kinase